MRLQDVKTGGAVTLREWPEKEIWLPGGGYLEWSDKLLAFVGQSVPVVKVDSAGAVRVQLPGTDHYRWWPLEYCDPVAVVEDFDIAAHRKQVLSLLGELADERRTVADLRKTVADLTQLTTSLESQVAALRADLQKIGKQTQNGSRFALLELD